MHICLPTEVPIRAAWRRKNLQGSFLFQQRKTKESFHGVSGEHCPTLFPSRTLRVTITLPLTVTYLIVGFEKGVKTLFSVQKQGVFLGKSWLKKHEGKWGRGVEVSLNLHCGMDEKEVRKWARISLSRCFLTYETIWPPSLFGEHMKVFTNTNKTAQSSLI